MSIKTNKLFLKSIVLTTFLQSLEKQGKSMNQQQVETCGALLREIDEAERTAGAVIDQTIDEAYADLLALIDTIPDEAVNAAPSIAYA